MSRWLIALFSILSVLQIIYQTVAATDTFSLLQNGNFLSQTSKTPEQCNYDNWRCYEEKDIMKDLSGAKFFKSEDTSFILLHREQAYNQGLMQTIYFPKPELQNFDYLNLQLEYQSVNVAFGKGTVYVNIRYTDGIIVPFWITIDLSKDSNPVFSLENSWQKECRLVSKGKQIESISVTLGMYEMKVQNSKQGSVVPFAEPISGFVVRNIKLEGVKTNGEVSLDPTSNLEDICPTMIHPRAINSFHVEPNAFERKQKFSNYDVTVVTQLSVDRLSRLLKVADHYRGPISASLVIRSQKDYEAVANYWVQYQLMREYVSIHMIYDQRDDENMKDYFNPHSSKHFAPSYSYPVNYARNIARKYTDTEYVLYVDADFNVPTDLFEDLTKGKVNQLIAKLQDDFKAVIVLPGYITKQLNNVPKNREELLRLLKSDVVERIAYASQSYVDFDRWENVEQTEEFYKIQWPYNLHFEPYFIAAKSIPLFSERFIGGARDKLSQTHATHLSGYEFFVWKKHFIVHMPHPENIEPLMPSWPPKEFNFHPVINHYHMVFREIFDLGKQDAEDEQKRTVLRKPKDVHREWLLRYHQFYNMDVSHFKEEIEGDFLRFWGTILQYGIGPFLMLTSFGCLLYCFRRIWRNGGNSEKPKKTKVERTV